MLCKGGKGRKLGKRHLSITARSEPQVEDEDREREGSEIGKT